MSETYLDIYLADGGRQRVREPLEVFRAITTKKGLEDFNPAYAEFVRTLCARAVLPPADKEVLYSLTNVVPFHVMPDSYNRALINNLTDFRWSPYRDALFELRKQRKEQSQRGAFGPIYAAISEAGLRRSFVLAEEFGDQSVKEELADSIIETLGNPNIHLRVCDDAPTFLGATAVVGASLDTQLRHRLAAGPGLESSEVLIYKETNLKSGVQLPVIVPQDRVQSLLPEIVQAFDNGRELDADTVLQAAGLSQALSQV